jgi:hypothetical protein
MKLQRKQKNNTILLQLSLSKDELIHIRDIMSVLMPPDCKNTFSEELAQLNNLTDAEENLWQKIHHLCSINNIDTDDRAPDFVVTIPQHPELAIHRLQVNSEEKRNILQNNGGTKDDSLELYDILMNKKTT